MALFALLSAYFVCAESRKPFKAVEALPISMASIDVKLNTQEALRFLLLTHSSLQRGLSGRPFSNGKRSVVLANEEASTCALIDLEAKDVLPVAKVLKKAWMEGGIKRGLVGSVLIPEDESVVRIACSGQTSKVEKFVAWINRDENLVKGVSYTEECPAVALTAKFPLADAEKYNGAEPGSFSGSLALALQGKSLDIKTKAGKTHSSDEGKA
eukprot:CAMPEP_0169106748 /NCGR_PEP_ID=MMETSP1015-20121227/24509_1 /TAXON_ID=342587 /ORGANISM="Karlodinium micrum, Strain CCMP2283" /LENGTH=211 /DNA_ID=CAMNT_0009168223 /DNA_START=49 /DNA_END=684 /DNA_ORIENTATION=+